MKARISARAALALASASAIAIAGVIVAPAHAATKTTVVLTESTPMNSLNAGTSDTNLVSNTDIAYLTGFGFTYHDQSGKLVQNPIFGSYKIVKNTATDFRVQYTVAPGRVWSDGTPIDGVDLLLSHVLSSSKYNIAAGLGDPAKTPTFKSFYNGVYDKAVVGDPVLSADHMSITVQYSSRIPDWDQYAPGPSPVHALELLAAGKKSLGSAAENAAAKALFLSDFQNKNATNLKAMAKVWNNDYNIDTVNASTNPLYLISNGNFIVQSCVSKQNCVLVENPKANSGPENTGITKIVFNYAITDAAAPQALANGELDIYQGQVTPDIVTQIKAIKGVTIAGGTTATYEHVDLRVGDGTDGKSYTGVFSDQVQGAAKAAALRKAFLLAFPREDINNKLIRVINDNSAVMQSSWVFPADPTYSAFIAKNKSSDFASGTQADRTAAALAIMKHYDPQILSHPLEVRMLYGTSQRRADEFALYKAEEAKIGFKVTGTPDASWSLHRANSNYDATVYAWVLSAPLQPGSCVTFQSDSGSNKSAWNDPAIDAICNQLKSVALSQTAVQQKWIAVERLVMAHAWTAPMFAWPAVTAYQSGVQNVKPAPYSPTLLWNYWQWHF
jgi:peptide/nickel transport system substrate-binding protein